jgi:molybdate transport system substrate-binding protein
VIPQSDHQPLRQRMVLLDRAGATVTQFYAYLQGQAAAAIFRKHGYGIPEPRNPPVEPR